MKLTKHSQNRLMKSLSAWQVDKDFADPMFNYLVYGFEPGGFFKGWYANDATSIIRSHPANTVESLKKLTKWMINCTPVEAWGSYEHVNNWLKMDAMTRRKHLENMKLIYTEHEEIMLVLKGEQTIEPILY